MKKIQSCSLKQIKLPLIMNDNIIIIIITIRNKLSNILKKKLNNKIGQFIQITIDSFNLFNDKLLPSIATLLFDDIGHISSGTPNVATTTVELSSSSSSSELVKCFFMTLMNFCFHVDQSEDLVDDGWPQLLRL